ncbi:MAG: PAS domain-containing protein [Betaproteobacteria bacterium]
MLAAAAAFFLAALVAFALAWRKARAARHAGTDSEVLSLVSEHVPSLIAYIGPDLRYRWCNRAYAEWFGRKPAELRGRFVPDVLGEEAWERVRPHAESALRGQETSYVSEVRARDGSLRCIEVASIPHHDARGRLLGTMVVGHDVTRRQEDAAALRQSERALRRNAEFQALLVSLHDATRGERDVARVVAQVVARAGRHFQASRCAYCEVDSSGEFGAIAHDYVDGVESMAGRHALASFGSGVIRDLGAGITVAIADVREDPRTRDTPVAEVFELRRIRATACVPLVKEGRLAGVFMLQQKEPRAWSADEVALMEQVAERTWLAVENARAETALRESRDVLALAMRGGRMGAWSRDLLTQHVWWSRELEEIFGLPPGGFPGTEAAFYARVHADDRDAVTRAVREATRTHEDYSVEFRFQHASGEWRWMEARGRTVYDAQGTAVMLYGIGTDVTERKLAEQALREADRRKDEFLATLAHELRNPLAPIRNAVHILHMKGRQSPEISGARDIIDRQARHMTRLVDDLLEASRITRGKVELRMENVPLAAVVNDALDAVRPLVEKAGHDLAVDLPPGDVMLRADPTRLTQVILNLLNNAVKYTPPRGHIRLSARVVGEQLAITVTDDGIGIPPDRLPHLFQMFSQVAPPLDRVQGGLGIGLALARGLVQLHGGTLEARSDGPGKGSRFVAHLPVVVGPDAAMPRRTAGAGIEASRPRRVLVVDDNRDAAESLVNLLRLMGHEVLAAYDGLEAVDCAQSFDPQVVLLDIGLPIMNGYEAARRIRQMPRGAAIRLVAVTGWGQDSDKRRALQAGFDHHLTKPVSVEQLQHVLHAEPEEAER